jgi:thymidylate synthase
MSNTDTEYFRLLETILKNGRRKKNRTGIDTIGVFGEQAKFNVDLNAFPILTTKRVWFKGILHELLWFIKGDTNIKYLVDNDVHIWDEWAYKRYKESVKNFYSQKEFIDAIRRDADFAKQWGDLGEGTYGGMWRDFPADVKESGGGHVLGVDQLATAIEKLRKNPDDRRIIVSAWHPYWVDHCALPPCHCLFHFNTEELTEEEIDACATPVQRAAASLVALDSQYKKETYFDELSRLGVPKRRVNLLLYQRSCDTFLGVPFNITSYALLLAMVAHCVNMKPGVFTHAYGDLHLYENSIEAAKLQMTRIPYPAPELWLNPQIKNLFDFKYDDVKLINYQHHTAIKVDVAV